MKILHTVHGYWPKRNGMQEVVMQLSEKLVAMGHQVTVATSYEPERTQNIINKVEVVSFKIKGNAAGIIEGETERYQELLLKGDFDIITNFAAQQWATDLALPVLEQIKAKKFFVPTGFSALNEPAYQAYFEQMKDWMKAYDMNIFLSDNYRDINFARKNGVTKIAIIPNGADEAEFKNIPYQDIRKMLGLAAGTRLILSVGNHSGYKGHAEAIRIFSKARIKNAALLIAGKGIHNNAPLVNLSKELVNMAGLKKTNCELDCKIKAGLHNLLSADKKIFVQELDRQQVVNAFKQADLFLFPSLIECSPIVLFEAMAGGTPFLATDVGNVKEIIQWSSGGGMLPTDFDKEGLSRAKINEAAGMLEQYMTDEVQSKKMGEAGHKAFLEQFTWQKIAGEYEKLYLQSLSLR